MTVGPVQIIIFGFDRIDQFHGGILHELSAARGRGLIRLIDIFLAVKDESGQVKAKEMTGLTQEETVELRLRQRIGAFELNRVLGRDDEELLAEAVGRVVDRDLALLHRLEQGGPRLWWSPVDFIGEQDLSEDRALDQSERAGLGVKDIRADQVSRHQVGRELHSAEVESEGRRQAAREQGLADSGHALEQDVSRSQVACEYLLDGRPLAGNQRLDGCADASGDVAQLDAIQLLLVRHHFLRF